ncbi:septum site-determining protein Ssd [Prauserella muralis]|uniref:Helicase n=1 Tax=Prauserella muralis TaxID=588067 RepID=A0A2V4B7H8_9PSEU|nr:septum site-determining protein Ssd [Prauserella muralis]PXY31200.1 helicase [Prauserella muralis]TWE14500.1 secretion/DNA translocation related CpaE-like protein [Prauserella muralis]
MQTDQRPLVAVADGTVLDEILRLAAAVGCEPECVSDLGAARGRWARAPLVLTDDESAASAATADLPRRTGVLLVRKGPPAAESWKHAVTVGADAIVALPDDEDALLAALADMVEAPEPGGGHVLAVLGGRGGAGASVLAAGIAVTAARAGGRCLLVDCDPLGGGIDLVLGAELSEGLRWPGLRIGSGRVSMSALDDALPGTRHGEGALAVLSCGREGPGPDDAAVAAVVDAGRRAGRLVVCDLPRRRGPGTDAVLERAGLVVLVVPAEVRACVAAARVLADLGDHAGKVRALARGPAPDGLTSDDVADAVGVPSLGWLRRDRGLGRALERGVFDPRPGGGLATASRAVLGALPAPDHPQ